MVASSRYRGHHGYSTAVTKGRENPKGLWMTACLALVWPFIWPQLKTLYTAVHRMCWPVFLFS